ncbi:HAD-IIB family hydrolase [uncultured Mobiluncus sp.]|uniref:HAD-IIB family hydrolase n=1 Tax=uncultured Mobiluncus sp. TaxID=293425 RepID=UPI0025E72E4B|nr:HAD-IIB family hydrolase [uncultured Mobiluncus sp.]
MRLVAFDLDDTLAPSKMPLDTEMAAALAKLLNRYEAAIISGGQLSQFQAQVLCRLTDQPTPKHTLHLLPTCGTQYYRMEPGSGPDELVRVYRRDLAADLRRQTVEVIETTARELGLWESSPWGNIIEDRGTQVTFSALGQQAPLAAKRAWDPDGSRKTALVQALETQLPQLEVRSGGATSVDVTARGVDKAYGIRSLLESTGYAPLNLVFLGDRLDERGNDYPVLATGVPCQAVSGPEDTLDWLRRLLA